MSLDRVQPRGPQGAAAAPRRAAGRGSVAPEDIRPREPAAAELAVAAAAYVAIPFDPPVYARIDLLQNEEGAPAVLELELTEPSLFFAQAAGAARRFAVHVLRAAAVTR